MSTSQDTKGQEILRIADEIRVRVHLAGMEAKEAWAKIEPKVTLFEHRLLEAADDAMSQFDLAALSLYRALTQLRARVVGRHVDDSACAKTRS